MRLVAECQRVRQKRALNFSYATKSFVGYLQGTEKAAHTISNYRGDLLSFQRFLEGGLGSRRVALSKITLKDVEIYHAHLRKLGLKTNTRRRKILTLRRFLRYLTKRNKFGLDISFKIPTPQKIERVPKTVALDELLERIRNLPTTSVLEARNRSILWTLAETGCQVSELGRLKFENWLGAELNIAGKAAGRGDRRVDRRVPVSPELFDAIKQLKVASPKNSDWLFLGYNRFGSLGGPISPRGVELLVRLYAARLGFPDLTPRTFRHSVVLNWFKKGLERENIRVLLGLKTHYAFRSYEALLGS